MTSDLHAVLALAIVTLLVSDTAAANQPEYGSAVPVNTVASAARLAALEYEVASLKSSLGHGETLAGASSFCPEPSGWSAGAEYLNWKARRDALDYATFDPGDEDIPQGPMVGLSYPSSSGVRGRLAYRSTCGWDVGVVYAHFHTTDAGAVSVPAGSNELTPILSSPFDAALLDVDSASASTEIDYDVFDLEVGHPWHIGDTLAGRCFAGFRWAIIDQDFRVLYEGNDTGVGGDGYSVQAPINFDGYGFRVGGEGQWNLKPFFGLFASGATSLLIGDFHTRYVLFDGDSDEFDADLTNRFQRIVPVLDLSVGASMVWGVFEVRGGYELVNWFNLVDAYDYPDDSDPPKLTRTPGDLGLHGFFLRGLVTF